MSKKVEIRLDEAEKKSLAQQLRYHLAAVESGKVDFTGFVFLSLSTCSEDECTRTHFNFGCHFPQDLPDEIFFTLLRGMMAKGIEEVAEHQRSQYVNGMIGGLINRIEAEAAKASGNIQ